MQKKFKIEVDCANCAAKIETAIKALPGVKNASVSFMAQKLLLEVDDDKFDAVLKDAVKTAKNPQATTSEQDRAAKVFTDMEGTELYEKLMAGSTELSIRIKGLIEIRLKKPDKEFTVPDNIEEFDIRKYV